MDAQGNAYLTGSTQSEDFPITHETFQSRKKGDENCFVTKLSPDATSLVYSTYLGGNNSGAGDAGFGIAVDSSGNAYVAGSSTSYDFPVTSGAYQSQNRGGYDGFVTKLSGDGKSLVYSTYIGGQSVDYIWDIALDNTGSAYLVGWTYSLDFPTTKGAFQTRRDGLSSGFIVKMSPDGRSRVYSTLLGGKDA